MASLSNINGLFDVHSTGAILFSTSHGTSGQILRSNGNAAPTWVAASTVIGGPYLPLTGGTLTGATATATGISFTVGGALTVGGNNVVGFSGSWNGANMPGSRWNGYSVNGGEIVFQRDNPNSGQMSILVDGGYYAGENNGFYSLYSVNSYNSKAGFYADTSGVLQFNAPATFTGLVSGITPTATANFATKGYVDSVTPGAGPFLPLTGGTLTGSLTITGGTAYGLNITTSGTQDTININRAANNDNAITKYQTASADKWIVGLRNTSDDNFRFYSYGTSTDILTINQGNGNTTFAGNITLTPGNSNKIILTPDVTSHYITGNAYWVDVVGNAAEVFRVFGGVGGTSEYFRIAGDGNVGIGIASPGAKLDVAGNITTPNQDLSSTATPTNFGVYTSEIRLIDTPNGGLKQCRVITDNYGEWILVGRFAASAMNSIANGNSWSSESGLDTSTSQSTTTKFSADFGDSYPTEVRIMGATDFTKWRDTRTVDFVYGVPEGRPWKYFFSGGVENGMALSTKYGWGINGAYDGFGRWVNPAQTFVRMSDGNVTNPSAAYTTATTNAFNWDGADDAKITVSATRVFSGQDTYLTTGFGNDDNIYGFFDEYPGEASNMNGGVDFSSAAWVLIKLPNASSGGASNDYWSSDGTNIVNTNSGSVQIGTKPTITPNANFDQLVITGTVHSGITILSGTTSDGGIYFGDSTFNGAGQIKYFHTTNSMTFTTDNDAATLTLDNQYLATFNGTIAGTSANTTEVGTYPTGAIKRIRMTQGGEIHFGDTTTAAPLGVTEGTWNNFADQDFLSVYSRNSFRVYSYPSSTSELMRIDDSGSYINGSNFGIGTTVMNGKLSVAADDGTSTPPLSSGIYVGPYQGNTAVGSAWSYSNSAATYTDFSSRYNNSDSNMRFIMKASATPVYAMTIKGDGRVGIGTTSPTSKLHVFGGSANTELKVTTNDNYIARIGMYEEEAGASHGGFIQYRGELSDRLEFGSKNSGTDTVHMSISDSYGNVGIGTAPNAGVAGDRLKIQGGNNGLGCIAAISGQYSYGVRIEGSNLSTQLALYTSSTSQTTQINFEVAGNSSAGKITTTTNTTTYTTSSDYRLKENIIPISDSISRINQLKPSRFNFIQEPNKIVDGFIAHEVQEIVPEAIVGEKDEVDKDGNPVHQGIDQAKLVPLLVAAIQELEARVKELENK